MQLCSSKNISRSVFFFFIFSMLVSDSAFSRQDLCSIHYIARGNYEPPEEVIRAFRARGFNLSPITSLSILQDFDIRNINITHWNLSSQDMIRLNGTLILQGLRSPCRTKVDVINAQSVERIYCTPPVLRLNGIQEGEHVSFLSRVASASGLSPTSGVYFSSSEQEAAANWSRSELNARLEGLPTCQELRELNSNNLLPVDVVEGGRDPKEVNSSESDTEAHSSSARGE